MAIEFNCHNCGKLLRTADDKAGREAKCPGCGEIINVPATSAVAPSSWSVAENVAAGDSSVAGEMKACPLCGEQIRAAAIKCRHCGEDLRAPSSSAPAGYLQPHRGGMILAFGIIGLVICAIFAPVAWVMANQDLREMSQGRMDPSGETLTRVGKILGIIGVCIVAAMVLFYCGAMILAGMAWSLN